MNIEFVKVKNTWKNLNIDYGWCIKITTIPQLLKYNSEVATNRLSQAFSDNLETESRGMHHNNKLGEWIDCLAKFRNVSNMNAMIKLAEDTIKTQFKLLEHFEGYYIQPIGSFIAITSSMEEYSDVIIKNNFIYPEFENKIKIFKWPRGKHWYAKVDEMDVVIDGIQKWNTKIEAERNVDKYISNMTEI